MSALTTTVRPGRTRLRPAGNFVSALERPSRGLVTNVYLCLRGFGRIYLAQVRTYGVTGSGQAQQGFLDMSQDSPSPGNGVYYLVKYPAPCGSWQTLNGAEPDRDAALP